MIIQYEELTDFQWEVIEGLFGEQRRCKLNLRNVLDAIFWLLRTGSQRRNMDSKYPLGQFIIISGNGKMMVDSKR